MNKSKIATHPLSLVVILWEYRSLIWQMTKREVLGRYRGSMLGMAWSFINPIMMLAVYTFVFSVVFNARWGGDAGSGRAEFAIILFAGLIVHSIFAECINRAPSLILANVNYVKKVIFPLEILPLVALGTALFNAVLSTLVLMLFYLIVFKLLHWTIILLPLVILPLIPLMLGLSWFLASIGVFLRDMREVVQIVTVILLFMSPIFYPMSALPEAYRAIFYLNPLTFIIEQVREVVIWGRTPDWFLLAGYFVVSLIISWMGLAWFQRTRKGFADVL